MPQMVDNRIPSDARAPACGEPHSPIAQSEEEERRQVVREHASSLREFLMALRKLMN